MMGLFYNNFLAFVDAVCCVHGDCYRGPLVPREDLYHRDTLKAHIKNTLPAPPHFHMSPGPNTHCKQLASLIFY